MVQYHRGVDSPYWALHEEALDRIGATLHFIDSSIDGGDIISQSKTENLSIDDQLEDIFMKTCIAGFKLLDKNISEITNGTVKRYPLSTRGKLYQVHDMDKETIKLIRNKTKNLLEEYINGNNSRPL